MNDLVAEKIDLENNFPRITRLVEAIRNREEFRKAVTQRIPQQDLLKQLFELPEGTRLSLRLPVKYE